MIYWVVTHVSAQKLELSPRALPVGRVFLPQRLLTEKSSVTAGRGLSEAERRILALCASTMAATLKDQGYSYSHSGINE